MTLEDIQKLAEELEAKRVELEAQNEQLQVMHWQLEESRRKYSDLYHFAPVSYLTLNRGGRILEANSTSALMLGRQMGAVVGTLLASDIHPDDRPCFARHLTDAFKSTERLTCELRLIKSNHGELDVLLDSIHIEDSTGNEFLRTAIIDISDRKRREEALREARDELELRVQERTAELVEANRLLRVEIEERNKAEEALRASEDKYKSIFEYSMDGILLSSLIDGTNYAANPTLCHMLGRTAEDICRIGSGIVPATPRMAKLLKDRERSGSSRGELQMMRADGSTFPAEVTSSIFIGKDGEKKASVIIRDITDRKLTEKLLRIQRDIAVTIGAASSMNEALDSLLTALLEIEGIDSGFVYIVDGPSGNLLLISHKGISLVFVQRILRHDAGSHMENPRLRGLPFYWPKSHVGPELDAILEKENLKGFAVVPVKNGDEVVAVLNLCSHTQSGMGPGTTDTLEAIAAQIGGVMARIRAQEALDEKNRHVEEVNAALGTLFKQRDNDKKALEESMLANVKNLVLPCVEKLHKSRLGLDQQFYLECLERHLKEITSPFISRLSYESAGLTPMEIRVSDLLRQGRSTKEIADLIGTSERSVHFHRQNIRDKLGLRGKRSNLRSYLLSLS